MKRSMIFGVALVSIFGAAIGLAGAGVLTRAQDPLLADDPLFDVPLIATAPPPIAESRRSESLDSNEFIDKGQSLASEAINALTAERDSLQERLEQINQELARWNAIQTGLSSAKDATPTVGPTDELDLHPLPEPAG